MVGFVLILAALVVTLGLVLWRGVGRDQEHHRELAPPDRIATFHSH